MHSQACSFVLEIINIEVTPQEGVAKDVQAIVPRGYAKYAVVLIGLFVVKHVILGRYSKVPIISKLNLDGLKLFYFVLALT